MARSKAARNSRTDRCLAAISRHDARTLVLGSLPGQRSLQMRQYYAHPQNSFWKLIAAIFEADGTMPYEHRVTILTRNRIALWDVLAAAERPGSLDSSIVHASVMANDFPGFFRRHPHLGRVFFNGRKAEQMYRRFVLPSLGPEFSGIRYASLPSTSPAHAGMTFAKKLGKWRDIKERRK